MSTRALSSLFAIVAMSAALIGTAVPTFAQPRTVDAQPGAELHTKPSRQGWFWYKDPEEKKDEAPPVVQPPTPTAAQPVADKPVVVVAGKKSTDEVDKEPLSDALFVALSDADREKRCSARSTWQKECGFIDPGTDFEFQAKQRDQLLQFMSISPDKPEAVEAAQRYMKWVVGKASQAANMWYFNMVQNPDLDPTVKNPISEVGLALASRVQDASQVEYFKLIKEEGGILFFFTRNDCIYCHDQAPFTKRVGNKMGLQVINVPLDGVCLPEFEGENCADNVRPEQAAVLDLKIVPALFLYVPSNTWIRLGTGVVTDNTVIANTVNFFSAYRAALIAGLENGKGSRPSVTFDPAKRIEASGVSNVAPSGNATEISQDRMMDLLGYK